MIRNGTTCPTCGSCSTIENIDLNKSNERIFVITCRECGKSFGEGEVDREDTMEIKKIPFQPNIGERFYYPSIDSSSLYREHHWTGYASSVRIQKYLGVYKTEEEAIAKAKELWNIA